MSLTLVAALSPSAAASADQYVDQQWGLKQIDAATAWQRSTGNGVVIGVVDTGVDASHPDLAGAIDATANCVGGACVEGPAPDGVGHGTSVAGIAAARRDNGVGIAGVAPDARLIVAKALDDKGVGDVADIANAIRWVVDHGAKVVNLSLGDPNLILTARSGTALGPAVEYAWVHGAIPVLASGNYNMALGDNLSANYGNIDAVVVGATNVTGEVSWFSSPLGNAKWGIVAPGGSDDHHPATDIVAPTPGGKYDWMAGTSFAAPHVSGTLALLLAEGLSPADAVHRMLETADHGRLRAGAALAPRPPPNSEDVARHHPETSSKNNRGRGILVLGLVALVAAGAVTTRRLVRN